MKKSLFNLASFVFLAFLSVIVPAYILATGSATLLPVAQFGAAFAGLGGLALAGFGAAMVYRAERRADITAHASLIKTHEILSGIPDWRKVAVLVLYAIQFVILLAIGSPVFAAYALAGLVGVLIHRGMLESYVSRLPKSKFIVGPGAFELRTSKSPYGREYLGDIGIGSLDKPVTPFALQGDQTYINGGLVRHESSAPTSDEHDDIAVMISRSYTARASDVRPDI